MIILNSVPEVPPKKKISRSIVLKVGYQCSMCMDQFNLERQLRMHEVQVHNVVHNGFRCDTCGKTFGTDLSLQKHMITHKPNTAKKKTQSREKNQNATNNATLSILQQQFSNKGSIDFKIPKKSPGRPKLIRTNNMAVLNANTLHKCGVCAAVFVSQEEFIEHMDTHLRYRCALCDKTYNRKESLKRHMCSKHE